MGNFVASASFCHGSVCQRKMAETDPELSKKIRRFDAFPVNFPREFFPTNSTQQQKKIYALHFLKRTLQRFASKTIQNHSKGVENIHYLRFRAI